ncbi:MAG TPA: 4Fe-4S binding protein [Methanothrix sp.]|nr:4Fe-4S binding protein [Methanothrix sp.]HOK58983.1 4Fe-4S binding protein [Methanothrix sp.]HOL44266.1 4Fe-4S binding protein [Methanothrix sp.]HPO89244.1 4Fe-4S binding protein [Methanothrix sp.]
MLEIEKDMDVEGSHVICRQRSGDIIKILDYDYKTCNGCGICISLCPTKALQSGPILEIATGLDAPPVLIDLDACVFCGMCANFCPVNAYRFTVNDVDIKTDDRYPRLLRKAEPNERCLPCTLCEPVCPTEAITVVFNKTRDDFGPLREGIEGEISVDREKCNLCGICARFCKAFVLLEREKDPRDLRPYEQLLIDEDLCDYCGLCVGICPEEAISVKGEPLDATLDLKGSIDVDQERCIGCGRCAIVCPYEAMDVVKPFEGEIRLVSDRLVKCDPVGCHGCFNVCPADCWYVDDQGRIGVVEDQCILCGACANACHLFGIDVTRTKVSHTPIKETPWASEWRDAIHAILTGEKRRYDVSGTLAPPAVERPPPPKIKAPERDPELLRRIDESLRRIDEAMRTPKVRYLWERAPVEEARRKIAARIAQEESG